MIRYFQYQSEYCFLYNLLGLEFPCTCIGNAGGVVEEGHLIGILQSTGLVIFEDKLSDIFPCTYSLCCCCLPKFLPP